MELKTGLVAIAKAMKVKFVLNDRPLSYEEIFSDTGLLPAIARRADQLSSLCLGYGIGIAFDEAEKSTLGVKITFDDITPDILRYMCITDVLYEFVSHAPSKEHVPLDELMYD